MTTDSHVARVIQTVEHSHDANLEHVEAIKIIVSVKKSAVKRQAKPAQLCADHSETCFYSYSVHHVQGLPNLIGIPRVPTVMESHGKKGCPISRTPLSKRCWKLMKINKVMETEKSCKKSWNLLGLPL